MAAPSRRNPVPRRDRRHAAIRVKLLERIGSGGNFRVSSSGPTIGARLFFSVRTDPRDRERAERVISSLSERFAPREIGVPPLRDRPGDIDPLVKHFLSEFEVGAHGLITRVSREALEVLGAYDWPGNIRELENSVERAVVLGRGEVLTLADLPAGVAGESREDDELHVEAGSTVISIPVGTPLAEVERRVILETLRSTGGDKSAAARRLGIATRTIYRKLDQAEQLKS
ncbi:MAG: helix-turn-helix domain-containing protein [Nitrospinota bacterium]|nr:helix-turn-helix domain-containing protein [Nitrospinota bacterium]